MKVKVSGGYSISGTVEIPGSKNDCLGILAATILNEEKITLYNVPNNTDILQKCKMFESAGSKISREGNILVLDHGNLNPHIDESSINFRTSVSLMGGLLARFGKCKVPKPAGDKIGERKIDIHTEGLTKMGATILSEGDFLICECIEGLKGIDYTLRFPSVGATQQLAIAACKAQGQTTLRGIAKEPEIMNMFKFLEKLGAKIDFIDTKSVTITPIQFPEKEISHTILVDKIQAFSYLAIAIMTEGEVTVKGQNILELLEAYLPSLSKLSCSIESEPNSVSVKYDPSSSEEVHICATPFPGFPTDFQPIIAPLICINQGGTIRDQIFPERFHYMNELAKVGANYVQEVGMVSIFPLVEFKKTHEHLVINDIRAGIALLGAALSIKGQTILEGWEHVLRGYENFLENLKVLGVKVEEITDEKQLYAQLYA